MSATSTTTGSATANVARHHQGTLLRDTPIIAHRNLLRVVRQPQIAIFVVIQPIMFVLLFRYVFGNAIPIPGFDYVQYLMPGIIVQTLVFGSAVTAIGITEDLKAGIIDRFRALPMASGAVMSGRVIADMAINTVSLVVMVAVGYAVGFRVTTSVWEAALAVALLAGLAMAFSWISAVIGLAVKEPEAAQSAGFIWLFPLTFVSSVFVPTAGMPAPLRYFAEHVNPVTHVANAARALTVDGYLCGTQVCTNPWPEVWWSLVWIVGITAVFLPLSIRMWRNLT
ncbi:MAG TPA: ABC transporter permease [Nitriliruptoraceae bacterium]|nr:ABC transporter permease [Nitriliruptoraceae bacterium]